jgi:hypothetical protein
MQTPDRRSGGHRALLLILALCAGVLIVYPRQGWEEWFDPGDRGRDLYAFDRTLHGDLPYTDYHWFYGPLMPFVYGGFCKVLGSQMSSVIIGKLFLTLVAAVLLFLAVSEVAAPVTAFFASVWFLVFYPEFFFTYNHIGGIAMILAVLWMLFAYVRTSRRGWALGGLFGCFVLALIKINFGVVAAGMCVLGVWLTDRLKKTPRPAGQRQFHVVAFGVLPLLVGAVYAYFLKGLALMEIRQCLPYWGNDEVHFTNPLVALLKLGQSVLLEIRADEIHLCVYALVACAVVRTAWLLVARKLEPERRDVLMIAIILLCVFYLANLHEYLRSGVGYRILWSEPLGMVLGFVLLDTAFHGAGRAARLLAGTAAVLMMGLSFGEQIRGINARKTPEHFLSCRRARVYVGNSREWIQTVETVTARLQELLQPGEMFFALPYDPLYCYLTERKSPTRQLILFRETKIPPWQERSILNELERNHVNYVLLSNLGNCPQEIGFGVLGETHCPIIKRYLDENFVLIAKYGDWTHEPLWSRYHGVMILRRKLPGGHPVGQRGGAATSGPATP